MWRASAACCPDNLNRRGFTLVELLVVILIIGLLLALLFGATTAARRSSQSLRVKADLNVIAQALEQYRNDFGAYPGTFPQDVPRAGILGLALIGPGPAGTYVPGLGYGPPDPATGIRADGHDGPGFRVVPNGKVWPPLLSTDSFPVRGRLGLDDGADILDYFGTPIQYFPRRRSVDPASADLLGPAGMYDPADGPAVPREALAFALGDRNLDYRIGPGETLKFSGPFVLVSAGPDEAFGTPDDIWNFDP